MREHLPAFLRHLADRSPRTAATYSAITEAFFAYVETNSAARSPTRADVEAFLEAAGYLGHRSSREKLDAAFNDKLIPFKPNWSRNVRNALAHPKKIRDGTTERTVNEDDVARLVGDCLQLIAALYARADLDLSRCSPRKLLALPDGRFEADDGDGEQWKHEVDAECPDCGGSGMCADCAGSLECSACGGSGTCPACTGRGECTACEDGIVRLMRCAFCDETSSAHSRDDEGSAPVESVFFSCNACKVYLCETHARLYDEASPLTCPNCGREVAELSGDRAR